MKSIAIFAALVSTVVLFDVGPAHAVPTTMSFTARITDDAGPVEGNLRLDFHIYDARTGGTLMWEEIHSGVAAEAGLVFVELGSQSGGNGLDASVFAGGGDRYIELSVNGDVQQPRIKLSAVPYATVSSSAERLGDLAAEDVQARIAQACNTGSSIRAINADGTVECESGNDATGDITSVVAGAGLTGGSTLGDATLAVDTGAIQSRVTGDCAVGSAIRAINSDGSVTCETDDDSGDITAVNTGPGLTGGDVSGAIDLGVDTEYLQRRVTGTCPEGRSVRAIHANGTVTCAAEGRLATDTSSSTTYLSGTCQQYANAELSITVPTSGQIVVSGQAWMRVQHATAGTDNRIEVAIGTSPTDCGSAQYRGVHEVPGHFPTSTNYFDATIDTRRTFSVSAGTHTYYVTGRITSGYAANTDSFWYASMDATFIPD